MSDAGELREMYFDAVRRQASTPGKYVSKEAIEMARRLCEADRQDPDRMISGLGGMIPENGPMRSLVVPTYIAPAWAAYLDIARNAIEASNAMKKEQAA